MHRILVSDPISDSGIETLRSVGQVDVRLGLSPQELAGCIGDYEALAVRSETKVTADILSRAANLKIIGRAGVGVDNIDVEAATKAGVVVVNSPEGNTIAAAELTFAMLLSLARNIPQADASMKAGKWDRKKFLGAELRGKTLGVVGLGKIGGEVCRRARAFEMKVLAYDPFATAERAGEYGASLATLEQVYSEADFITVHVPLNDQTRGMISTNQLNAMKDGVRIINCARGGVIDEAALAAALTSGKVAGAACDVFTKEPILEDNPLLTAPNCILTPHLGASTEEAQVLVAIDIAEQICDVLRGRPARSAVNLPSVSEEALRKAQPFCQLAEKMGLMLSQLSSRLDGQGNPVEAVEVSYAGDFSGIPLGVVTRSALVGLLTPALSDPVNLVNAPGLAAQRGIKTTESHTTDTDSLHPTIQLSIQTPERARTAIGVVFDNDLRVQSIDGYRVDIQPTGRVILTEHTDRPGVIGSVGTLLGNNRINIAGMQLGRDKIGGRALMALMVDDPVSQDLLEQIRALPGMETARAVEF